MLKRDYALFQPSYPKYGMRHSPLPGSQSTLKQPVPRTEEDDPAKVAVVEKVLARRGVGAQCGSAA